METAGRRRRRDRLAGSGDRRAGGLAGPRRRGALRRLRGRGGSRLDGWTLRGGLRPASLVFGGASRRGDAAARRDGRLRRGRGCPRRGCPGPGCDGRRRRRHFTGGGACSGIDCGPTRACAGGNSLGRGLLRRHGRRRSRRFRIGGRLLGGLRLDSFRFGGGFKGGFAGFDLRCSGLAGLRFSRRFFSAGAGDDISSDTVSVAGRRPGLRLRRLRSQQTVILGASSDSVGLSFDDARRMRLDADAERDTKIKRLLIGQLELFGELVDADLAWQYCPFR